MSTELMTLNQARAEMAKATWIAKRDAALDDAALIASITTEADNATATRAYADLRACIKELETARKTVTAPIDALKKQIMDQEKELVGRAVAEFGRIKMLTDEYATKQLCLKCEAEVVAEAARRQAVEDAVMAGVEVTAPSEAVLTQAPTANTASTTASSVWRFYATDKRLLPLEYLIVNEVAVNAMLRMKKAQGLKPEEVNVPGLEVYEAAVTRSR